jgi:hypothetical protein
MNANTNLNQPIYIPMRIYLGSPGSGSGAGLDRKKQKYCRTDCYVHYRLLAVQLLVKIPVRVLGFVCPDSLPVYRRFLFIYLFIDLFFILQQEKTYTIIVQKEDYLII